MARTEPVSQHGWFTDPEDPQRLRMWDGKRWTSLTKYPARDEAPASGPATVPAGRPVSGPGPADPLPRRPAPRPQPSTPSTPSIQSTPFARGGEPARHSAAHSSADASFVAGNLYSLITLGVALVCIIVASATGWVFVGVLPVLVAIRAFRDREPMAPFAGLGAAAAVVIALVLLAR